MHELSSETTVAAHHIAERGVVGQHGDQIGALADVMRKVQRAR